MVMVVYPPLYLTICQDIMAVLPEWQEEKRQADRTQQPWLLGLRLEGMEGPKVSPGGGGAS